MRRFFRWLSALFNRQMDRLEDPELMLDQARRDMQQTLISNREKAVQAITQKNRLQSMVDESQRKSAQLEAQATTALRQGNRDLARQFLREKGTTDQTLETLKGTLGTAVDTVEAVKVAVKRQEEEVRRKTAEALAMKAQWKQTQIQNSIAKALEGLTFENQFEAFGAASERIRDAQSEAAARQEMMSTSLQGKTLDMQDKTMDYAAEEELRKLEERLGLAQNTGTVEQQQQAPEASNVEQELEQLEQRMNQGNAPQ